MHGLWTSFEVAVMLALTRITCEALAVKSFYHLNRKEKQDRMER